MINQRGFSLIELMVVLAILGMLAAIAIPNYQSSLGRAGYTEAKSELQLLQKTMEDYYLINDLSYSTNLNTVTGISGTIYSESKDYTFTASTCSDGAGGQLGLSECVLLTGTGPLKSDNTRDKFTIDSQGNKTFNGNDGWPE